MALALTDSLDTTDFVEWIRFCDDWQPDARFWRRVYGVCQCESEKELARLVVKEETGHTSSDQQAFFRVESNLLVRRQTEFHLLDVVPPLYRGGWATLGKRSPTLAQGIRTMTMWLEQFLSAKGRAHGWYIWGPVGTGKTALVHGLRIELAKRRYTQCLFRSLQDYQNALHECYAAKDKESTPLPQDVNEPLQQAGLLIFDDLGSVSLSESVRRYLYQIIDYRYGGELPLIFTSNRSWAELLDGGGSVSGDDPGVWGRVADRLREMVRPLKIDGRSIRQEKGADDE